VRSTDDRGSSGALAVELLSNVAASNLRHRLHNAFLPVEGNGESNLAPLSDFREAAGRVEAIFENEHCE
jgi:hypothetical protein